MYLAISIRIRITVCLSASSPDRYLLHVFLQIYHIINAISKITILTKRFNIVCEFTTFSIILYLRHPGMVSLFFSIILDSDQHLNPVAATLNDVDCPFYLPLILLSQSESLRYIFAPFDVEVFGFRHCQK